MQPVPTMLAFLPKPGIYHSSQSVFASWLVNDLPRGDAFLHAAERRAVRHARGLRAGVPRQPWLHQNAEGQGSSVL
jgi:hypothetical protein